MYDRVSLIELPDDVSELVSYVAVLPEDTAAALQQLSYPQLTTAEGVFTHTYVAHCWVQYELRAFSYTGVGAFGTLLMATLFFNYCLCAKRSHTVQKLTPALPAMFMVHNMIWSQVWSGCKDGKMVIYPLNLWEIAEITVCSLQETLMMTFFLFVSSGWVYI